MVKDSMTQREVNALRCFVENRLTNGQFSLGGRYELTRRYGFDQNDLRSLAKKGVLQKDEKFSSNKHTLYGEGPKFAEVIG